METKIMISRLKIALRVAYMALEQGTSLSSHIAANGPTVADVIEEALALQESAQPAGAVGFVSALGKMSLDPDDHDIDPFWSQDEPTKPLTRAPIPAREWIPSRKQKPNDNREVLGVVRFADDLPYIDIVTYDSRDKEWTTNSHQAVRVTYWCNLPELPSRKVQ
jgi:hypothetical protein